jgi:hypothetical protein|tara:strand:+ start:3836 stop:4279 length:444 start_codon:yes stop_codon:yes gene_type:complete
MIYGGAMEAAEKLKEYQVKNNKNNKFDIDLDFGVKYENSLAKILAIGKVEVKTERDKWKETGNIAIELTCRGKDSGIKVTEAEWWAHILSWKGNIKSVILLPVDELKRIVKNSVRYRNGRIVMGGDDNASEMALIPLEDLANEFRKE